MRPLTLHASALNDSEYNLYTTSLTDLAWVDDTDKRAHDDAYYEQMKIGLRETRGWLRGRYAQVSPASIDAILRFFSPVLSHNDALTGGQFFAALRLVVHVANGKEIDRSLAFVQAYPSDSNSSVRASPPPPSLRRKTDVEPPTPVSTSRPLDSTDTNPSFSSNPFSAPPQHPSHRPDSLQSAASHTSHNPFVNRPAKTKPVDLNPKLPPLPPRKPPPQLPAHAQQVLIPPPRHNSILPSGRKSVSPSRAISFPGSTAHHHPPVPPKPAHVTSTLMKQSLQASKAAQTMKKAESQLEKERVMQVLKSSSVVSGGYSMAGASVSRSSVVIGTNTSIRNRSASPTKVTTNAHEHTHEHRDALSRGSSSSENVRAPPLPRRRNTYQQPSPPVSISSLEQVALAVTPLPPSGSNVQPPPAQLPPHLTSPFETASDPFRNLQAPTNPYRSLPNPTSYSHVNTFTRSPSASPSRPSVDLPLPDGRPPPMHPQRKLSANFSYSTSSRTSPFQSTFDMPDSSLVSGSPFRTNTDLTSESSPTSRIFRSKSLHHPSSPPPPVPPPLRRKRPESVQMLGPTEGIFDGPSGISGVGVDSSPEGRRPGSTLSRHTSLSTPSPAIYNHHRRTSSHSVSNLSTSTTATTASNFSSRSHPVTEQAQSPLSDIRRTLTATATRLEKARYKAEAGLSKRGYVKDRSPSQGGVIRVGSGIEKEEKEDLMREEYQQRGWERGRTGAETVSGYDSPGVDSDADADDGTGEGDSARWSRETRERWAVREKEELKWPAGEGWRPL